MDDFARRGIDIDSYPSVKRHLEVFRLQLEPKPPGWKASAPDEEWLGRKEGGYAWYEIQDSVDYFNIFEKTKIIYQEIQFYARYALDTKSMYSNNKTFVIETGSKDIIANLNSPLLW